MNYFSTIKQSKTSTAESWILSDKGVLVHAKARFFSDLLEILFGEGTSAYVRTIH